MKKLLLSLVALASLTSLSSVAFADVSVRGYYRKDGTYVQPHHRTAPNAGTHDNWTTRGNVNPYTGEEGTLKAHPNKSANRQGKSDGGRSSGKAPRR